MWFSSGSVVGRGVWWFVGRLSFEICPDAFMLPVLLIQIWIISGQWLNLVSSFFFQYEMQMLHCCRQMSLLFGGIHCWPIQIFFLFFYTVCFYNISYSFSFFYHSLSYSIYTHKNTFHYQKQTTSLALPLAFSKLLTDFIPQGF